MGAEDKKYCLLASVSVMAEQLLEMVNVKGGLQTSTADNNKNTGK